MEEIKDIEIELSYIHDKIECLILAMNTIISNDDKLLESGFVIPKYSTLYRMYKDNLYKFEQIVQKNIIDEKNQTYCSVYLSIINLKKCLKQYNKKFPQ